VRAKDLSVGAALVSLEGPTELRLISIEQLRIEGGSGPTYNLHVAGQDGYFAGGVFVNDTP
jgi:hypothetical protein